MNRISKFFAISAFALIFLGLPAVASAQWRDRDDDDYYGNNRNNRNLRSTLQNLKNRARNFENVTNRVEDRRDDRDDDRWGNRGPWGNDRNTGWGNNRRRGDYGRLEDLADRFRKATDDLADEYGNGRNLNNSRDEARRVLDIGGQIDNELRNLRGGRNLNRQWDQIRSDLNAIANVYGNYGAGRYGNGNRNGDWRNRVPFPLPF